MTKTAEIDEESESSAWTTPYLGPNKEEDRVSTRETPMASKVEPPAPTPESTLAPRSMSALSTGPRAVSDLPQTTDEFMRRVSATQTRLTAFAVLALMPVGFATLLLGNVTWVTIACGVSFAIQAATFAVMAYWARDEREHQPRRLRTLSMICAVTALPELLFYGVFSYFGALVLMLLMQYAMDDDPKYSTPIVLSVAAGHLTLQLLVMAGLLDDPGIMVLDSGLLVQGLFATLSTSLYVIALIVGQSFLKKTLVTANGLETAARELAGREAVLREARMELARVAGIGEPGRFTDQVLGNYHLGVVLGRGGMGEIYEAEHIESAERAAVKLIRKREGLGPVVLARFVREARTMASLNSPHVVKVYEIGDADAPLPYLAMERLDGADLSDLLRDIRRLPPGDVVRMVGQVAEALEAARAKDIVHRDIKPPNLFRTTEGTWKLLDFGVARLAGRSRTLTGRALVGTPAYMAPEQAYAGRRIDHRTDVYSLAVVAYRALSGRPPFGGADLVSIVQSVVHGMPTAPSELCDVPSQVDDVLRIGMAKDASKRFDTAKELAEAFRLAWRGKASSQIRERASALNAELPWGQQKKSEWEPAIDEDSDEVDDDDT